jgi:hypothetical protein
MEFDPSIKGLNDAAALRIQRLGEGLPFMLPIDEDTQRWMSTSTQGLQNEQSGKKVTITDADAFSNYDPSSGNIPLFVYGEVLFDQKSEHLKLGIGINGKICAVTETFPANTSREAFGSLIPESCLSRGPNQVQVVIIPKKDNNPLLIPSAK